MERIVSFSHFSSGDSYYTLPTLSPNTLNYYIMNVDTLIDQREQPNFKIAVKKFKEFVLEEYISRKESGEDEGFINEIISEIFHREDKLNILTKFILSEALFDINIGNKTLKANRIAQEIDSLEPTDNEDVFIYLDKILVWISKMLKSSIQFIIQPLTDIIWHWNDSTDVTSVIGSFILLRILFKRFNFFFKSHVKNIVDSIIHGTQSDNDRVRHYTLLTLDTILDSDVKWSNTILENLCIYFRQVILQSLEKEIYGTRNFIHLILEKKPEYKKHFEFKKIPLSTLTSYDKLQKRAMMVILPTILIVNKYDSSVYEAVFRSLAPSLKRRSPTLKEACICLGRLVFSKNALFSEQENLVLTALRPILFKQLDNPCCLYAYLSLLTTNYITFERDLKEIPKLPLSQFMIDGLVECSVIFLSEFSFIQKYMLTIIDSIIFNKTKNPATIILAFKALDSLHMEKMLSEELVLEFSLCMLNSNRKVRKKVSKFLLKCHEFNPTVKTAVAILDIISREHDQTLREEIMTGLKKEPASEVIASYLQELLIYESKIMRYHVLLYLMKCIKFPFAYTTLNEFLTTEIQKLKEGTTNKKPIIRTFLALCVITHLEDEPKEAEAARRVLLPFISPLMQIICKSKEHVSTSVLILLMRIVELSPLQADTKALVEIVTESLVIHHSSKHITAALKLLYALVHYTDCSRYFNQIVMKMAEISSLLNDSEQRLYILKIMSAFGPIMPSITNFLLLKTNEDNSHKTELSSLRFANLSSKMEPFDILMETSYNISVSSIINVLMDESLATLHNPAFEALVTILKQEFPLHERVQNNIIVFITSIIKESNMPIISRVLGSIQVFANSLSTKFAEVIDVLVEFVCKKWKQLDSIQLIDLCEILMKLYPDAFIAFFPRIATLFASALESQSSEIVERIIDTFVSFGRSIKLVEHIILPAITSWLLNNATDTKSSLCVLQGLVYIIVNSKCEKYYALIMQTLVNIASVNSNLKDRSIHVLVAIAIEMGQPFLLFVPGLSDTFSLANHPIMMKVLPFLEEGFPFTPDILNFAKSNRRTISFSANPDFLMHKIPYIKAEPKSPTSGIPKIPQQNFTEDEWNSWYDDTLLKIIHSSPSIAISSCELLVQKYSPFKETIFSVALAIFYVQKDSEYSTVLDTIVKTVSSSSTAPKYLCSVALSFLEILETMGMQSPLPLTDVAKLAIRSGNVAQGLRALENIYEEGQQNVFNNMVILNRIIGKPYSNYYFNSPTNEESLSDDSSDFSILSQWDTSEASFGCSKDLQEYSDSDSFATFNKPNLIELDRFDQIRDMTPNDSVYHALALWRLNDLDNFMETANLLDIEQIDSIFFKAYYHVARKEKSKAKALIAKAQEMFSEKIIPSIFQNYNSMFHRFSLITRFYELEEVMYYQSVQENTHSLLPEIREEAEKQSRIIMNKWKSRFKYYIEDASILQTAIQVHSLAFDCKDLHDEWDRLINCVINSDSIPYAQQLISSVPDVFSPNEKTFYKATIEYANGNIDKAISLINLEGEKDKKFISKVEKTVGIWLYENGRLTEASERIKHAAENEENNPEVWKQWATVNHALFNKTKEKKFCINTFKAAIKGLFYDNNNYLSFLLKVIEILFSQGDEELCSILLDNLDDIPIRMWIEVLPQLIARTKSHRKEIRNVIHHILLTLSKMYPNIALSSIMVTLKGTQKNEIADDVFDLIQRQYPHITGDTTIFFDELIRCAVFWSEMIIRLLLDSKKYLSSVLIKEEERIELFASKLTEFHKIIDKKECKSFIEISFIRKFGPELDEAYSLICQYSKTKERQCIITALNSYNKLIDELTESVNKMKEFDLNDSSPILYELLRSSPGHINVMVPGKHSANNPKEQELISNVLPKFIISDTPNRSRRFDIISNAGKKYSYLLKGNEDIRLDQRVLQIFTFINFIVDKSVNLFKSKVSLTTFSAIPIRQDVGLIGVVDDTESLLDAIKAYRKKHIIPLNAEENYAKTIRGDYNVLTDSEKLEVFDKSLEATKGNDLKQLLLLNANNSNHWIARRVEYTATLAIGSIAGYILGLGERKPENILIKKDSARIVHVNFNKIFEMANEWIDEDNSMPFRLTRIITNALELSKADGSFRTCAEQVYSLITHNRDDIISLLDVFIYDPIFQWKKASSTFYFHELNDVEFSQTVRINRIKDKLATLDPQEIKNKIGYLISVSSDKKNICKMRDSWRPWW